jgi:hypothetical protein
MSGEVGTGGTRESSEAADRILLVVVLVLEIEDEDEYDSVSERLARREFCKRR